jgi:two-component system chemotaxis response regulator CheB
MDVQEHSPKSLQSSPAFDLVVVASSVGGIPALKQLLSAIPADFSAALAVVQHMSTGPSPLVHILGRMTRLPVKWAEDGAAVEPGAVVVAPPDRHLLIRMDRTFGLLNSAKINFVRPAADLLFESAALAFGERTLGVVLTGSGKDGAVGARAIKNRGGRVLAQGRPSCLNFQMPLASIETGAVDFVLPLEHIATALVALVTVPGAAHLFRVSPDFSLAHVRRYRHAPPFSLPPPRLGAL